MRFGDEPITSSYVHGYRDGCPAGDSLIAGMLLPHGGMLFLVSWLSMAAVSPVVFALLTVFGSAGLLLALLYLILMDLPSVGAVVRLEALPGFFDQFPVFQHNGGNAYLGLICVPPPPDRGACRGRRSLRSVRLKGIEGFESLLLLLLMGLSFYDDCLGLHCRQV